VDLPIPDPAVSSVSSLLRSPWSLSDSPEYGRLYPTAKASLRLSSVISAPATMPSGLWGSARQIRLTMSPARSAFRYSLASFRSALTMYALPGGRTSATAFAAALPGSSLSNQMFIRSNEQTHSKAFSMALPHP
jgi:hypothetical protein